MQSVLNQIVPLDEAQSRKDARFFNQTGRRRALRIDALIAACATLNVRSACNTEHLRFRVFCELRTAAHQIVRGSEGAIASATARVATDFLGRDLFESLA